MARRYYSSTAVETTLSGSISNSATSITVTALSGFPNTTPWTAILDADTASEELVEVTNVAGTTLTVTRGVDGTAAVSHNAGASFRHGVSARDFDEANDHVNDSTGVHGLGASSSVVGTTDTQTLTNKTIDIASNTLTGVAPVANPTFTGVASFPDGSESAPSVTNDGDTNTGLFFPAADTVAISTGGTERLRVNSNSGGRVGIGTTNPQANLHLSSSSSFLPQQYLENTNTDSNPAFLIFRKMPSDNSISASDNLGQLQWSASDTGGTARTAGYVNMAAVSQGATFVEGQMQFVTTNSSGSITEKMRIDGNGLITGTGTSLGAWTTYTPTLGGTGWALGDGTVNGAYCQIGKIVAVFVRVLMGSSTTFGGVSPTISLPVTNSTRAANQPVVKGRVTDASLGASYEVTGLLSSGTAVLSYIGVDGLWTAITSSAPFSFTNGDFVTLGFTYEAA